ncbi:MAG: thiamine diphosphokinase [Egibacteraceae bacterium]
MIERSTQREVVVLAGGDPVPASLAAALPRPDRVIAADSGLAAAEALGLAVDLVVGDMDSVDPALLARAEADGARVERHPAAKDATDLALALDAARDDAPARVTVVGGHGGRLDHLLAGVLLLASERYAGLEVGALMGTATVAVVRERGVLTGQDGEVVSLLAVGGPARGVETAGLAYPLAGETLWPGSTRGVSNALAGQRATITLAEGVLLAIQPGAHTPDPPAAGG